MSEETEIKTEDIPEWAAQPFRVFMAYCSDNMTAYRRAATGLRSQAEQQLATAIRSAPSEQHESLRLETHAELLYHAHLLFSQSAVALWGCLEVFVRELLGVWMMNRPEVLARFTRAEVRLPSDLIEYEQLSSTERYERLAALLIDRSTKPERIDKYEIALNAVGLGGPLRPDIRTILCEFGRVRNVLVHRVGVADRKFAAGRDDLADKVGSVLIMNRTTYIRYLRSLMSYNVTLMQRVFDALAVDADMTKLRPNQPDWLDVAAIDNEARAH